MELKNGVKRTIYLLCPAVCVLRLVGITDWLERITTVGGLES